MCKILTNLTNIHTYTHSNLHTYTHHMHTDDHEIWAIRFTWLRETVCCRQRSDPYAEYTIYYIYIWEKVWPLFSTGFLHVNCSKQTYTKLVHDMRGQKRTAQTNSYAWILKNFQWHWTLLASEFDVESKSRSTCLRSDQYFHRIVLNKSAETEHQRGKMAFSLWSRLDEIDNEPHCREVRCALISIRIPNKIPFVHHFFHQQNNVKTNQNMNFAYGFFECVSH